MKNATIRKVVSCLLIIVYSLSLAACGGGGGSGSSDSGVQTDDEDSLHSADLAAYKTIYFYTGDYDVPYMAFYRNKGFLSVLNPEEDGLIHVIYTSPIGENVVILGTDDGMLLQAAYGDYFFLYNDQAEYLDVAITDESGSFTRFHTTPTASASSLEISMLATSPSILSTHGSDSNAFEVLKVANSLLGKFESGFEAFPSTVQPTAINISRAIAQSLKGDVYSIIVNGAAEGLLKSEESKIVAGIYSIVSSHASCLSGSATSCISNMITAVEGLYNLTKIGLEVWEESQIREEMRINLEGRMRDDDLDGQSEVQGDCNDNDPTIYRGAPEKCDDGIDQNCDGKYDVTDNCKVCDSDPKNDCVQDCALVWGGLSTFDNCGTCDSNPYNDCSLDCNGDDGGTAFYNSCGICVGGNSPNNDPCEIDCNGDANGTAYTDECGRCVGGNSPNTEPCETDCNGDENGAAFINDCDVCVGGNSPNTDPCELPEAIINSSQWSGPVPLTVTFNGSQSSSKNGAIINYLWSSSDGQEASGAQVSLTFNKIDAVTVNLTVTDVKGLSKTAKKLIVIGCEAPNLYCEYYFGGAQWCSNSSTPRIEQAAKKMIMCGHPTESMIMGFQYTYNEDGSLHRVIRDYNNNCLDDMEVFYYNNDKNIQSYHITYCENGEYVERDGFDYGTHSFNTKFFSRSYANTDELHHEYISYHLNRYRENGNKNTETYFEPIPNFSPETHNNYNLVYPTLINWWQFAGWAKSRTYYAWDSISYSAKKHGYHESCSGGKLGARGQYCMDNSCGTWKICNPALPGIEAPGGEFCWICPGGPCSFDYVNNTMPKLPIEACGF